MIRDRYVRWPSEEPNEPGKNGVRPAGVPTWTSARYCLAYMAFLGFFNVYALRVNLSVAIISMANSTDTHKISDECSNGQTNHTMKNGEFDWTSSQTALVLGSFFYGYICTQILGGYLASRFGGKYLFGGGVFCTCVFTLVTPVAARASFPLLIAARVLAGLGEGVTFPAMHSMSGVWDPPLERSKLISMGFAGSHFGTFVSMPISGLLCNSDFLGGWPSVFYIFGTLGLVWCLMWFCLIHNRPRDHPRISDAELQYIESTLPQEESFSIPWKDILTSRRVWGIVCAHFAGNWGFYTLLTCLPMYLKYVLGFDITQNGFISALPYLSLWVVANVSGFVADHLRERGLLTTTQTRKIFTTIGLLGPAGCLVAAGYVGCNNTLTVAFICLSCAFNGLTFSGYNANHVDIASRYAGILMGITNTFGTIPGFISPIVVEKITGDDETREQWRYVFFIAFGIYVLGAILFNILATGEEQEWNKPKHSRNVLENSDQQPLVQDDHVAAGFSNKSPSLNNTNSELVCPADEGSSDENHDFVKA